jgi:hypothetical protein
MFQQRPSTVARWQAWELDLLDEFLEREPCAADRIEISVARLNVHFAAAHRREGAPAPKLLDFLPYLKAWPDAGSNRYSDVDKEIMKAML